MWNGNPGGSLAITTAPVTGSAVNPGDEITVNASWTTGEFANEELDKVDACVTIGGAHQSEPLSDLEKPSANDGTYSHTFTVPADAPSARTGVCVRVGAHGEPTEPNPSTQKSNRACWDVVAPPGDATSGGDTDQRRRDQHRRCEQHREGNNGGENNTGTKTVVQGANQTQTDTVGSEVFGIQFDAGSSAADAPTSPTRATSPETASPSASALPLTSGGTSPRALAATGSATQALLMCAGLALLLAVWPGPSALLGGGSPRRAANRLIAGPVPWRARPAGRVAPPASLHLWDQPWMTTRRRSVISSTA